MNLTLLLQHKNFSVVRFIQVWFFSFYMIYFLIHFLEIVYVFTKVNRRFIEKREKKANESHFKCENNWCELGSF